MINIQAPVIMRKHITHPSGKRKTVCVTACLTALGVPFDSFQYTGSLRTENYLSILGRHGFSTRSRKSKMPKRATIGACRKAISELTENAYYFVIVHGKGYCHALLLNNLGETVVDTSPRNRDVRKVHSIHAVTSNFNN